MMQRGVDTISEEMDELIQTVTPILCRFALGAAWTRGQEERQGRRKKGKKRSKGGMRVMKKNEQSMRKKGK